MSINPADATSVTDLDAPPRSSRARGATAHPERLGNYQYGRCDTWGYLPPTTLRHERRGRRMAYSISGAGAGCRAWVMTAEQAEETLGAEGMGEDNLALVLGQPRDSARFVIDGTRTELLEFATRVQAALQLQPPAPTALDMIGAETVDLPGATVHLVQRETIDGLYLFVDADQAAEYAALYPGADSGAVQILGRSAAAQLLIDSQPCPHCGETDCDPDCETVLARCPCGSNTHDLGTHPTSANIGFQSVIGEYLMDDPIAEHRDGEHASFLQPDCCGACKREEIIESGNDLGMAGGVGHGVEHVGKEVSDGRGLGGRSAAS